MPEVKLPTEFEVENDDDDDTVSAGGGVRSLSGGSDDQYRADVYVGVLFDGYDRYANLTEAEPSLQFQFFYPPTFDTADLIVYRPQSLTSIDITVRRLVAFCQLANLYLPQKKRKNTTNAKCSNVKISVCFFVCKKGRVIFSFSYPGDDAASLRNCTATAQY